MSTTPASSDNKKRFTVRMTWDYSANRSVYEHVYHGKNGVTYCGVYYDTQEQAQKWADIENARLANND